MYFTSDVSNSVLEHWSVIPKQKHLRQSSAFSAWSLKVPWAPLHIYTRRIHVFKKNKQKVCISYKNESSNLNHKLHRMLLTFRSSAFITTTASWRNNAYIDICTIYMVENDYIIGYQNFNIMFGLAYLSRLTTTRWSGKTRSFAVDCFTWVCTLIWFLSIWACQNTVCPMSRLNLDGVVRN